MANQLKYKARTRTRRAIRVRAALQGNASRPRLTVFRSQKHISAQIIDDTIGRTLASASDHDVKSKDKPLVKAKEVGKILAERAGKAGVKAVAFDRGSFRYHGRVAALADGAREGGLNF